METHAIEQARRILEQGASFEIAARSHLFPPREVSNAFFTCGYDDLRNAPDSEEVLRWEPFALSAVEYDALFAWWRASHPDARIDPLGVTDADFSYWFTAATGRRHPG